MGCMRDVTGRAGGRGRMAFSGDSGRPILGNWSFCAWIGTCPGIGWAARRPVGDNAHSGIP
jgi:hypothetical protein